MMDNWTNWMLNIDEVEEEEGPAMDVEEAADAPVIITSSSADIAVGESTSSEELKEKGRSLDEGIAVAREGPEAGDEVTAGGESAPGDEVTAGGESAPGDEVTAGGESAPGDEVTAGGGPASENNGSAVAIGESIPKKKKKNMTRKRRTGCGSTTSTDSTVTSAPTTSQTSPRRKAEKKRTIVDSSKKEKEEDLAVGEDDKKMRGRVVIKEDGEEDDVEWLIEKIMKKRITKAGGVEYRVKWVDWDSSYNTWEPPEHLSNSPLILAEFEQKLKEKNERVKRARKKPISACVQAPPNRPFVPPSPPPTSAQASSLAVAGPSSGEVQVTLEDHSGQGQEKEGEIKDKGEPVPSTSAAAALLIGGEPVPSISAAAAALLIGREQVSAPALAPPPVQEKEKKFVWMNIQGHMLPIEKYDTPSEYSTDSEEERADQEFVQHFMGPTFYRRWPKDKTPLAILGTNVTNNTRLIFVRLKPDDEAEAREILNNPWEGMDLTNCIMVPTSGFRDQYPQMLIDFFRSGFTLKD